MGSRQRIYLEMKVGGQIGKQGQSVNVDDDREGKQTHARGNLGKQAYGIKTHQIPFFFFFLQVMRFFTTKQ